ncbi:bacteriocin-protection protein [Paenibacillus swuensis]|uniref:Bacteriocin-protection protein n=1 Tax=Paenibacillus swuensis TaxID=1178515 RepID=A0A172TKA1_9BACL|nr:YdeI/OmpD-associated family protein [Paenibacillus swuensis]ANE47468.1 bacteriocin-protection protein [Paenibacillus swuensis]
MTKHKDPLPVLLCESKQAWHQWLEHYGSTSQGVRLQIAKKKSGVITVSYDEALESALCYGWIDSQKEVCDEFTWLQRFTPRGKKSIWSKVNVDKAERLISEGLMRTAGLKTIEEAKLDGRWDKAYLSQSKATVPEDLAAALGNNPKAKAFFEGLNATNRYAILFRINNVKKQETRERKIQQFVTMLENGETIYS